jgi:oxygen-dependent protoporphyrinogen oxidase
MAREFPESKITIYEGQKETGGWIKSKRVPVPGGGDVLFEYGARTLRPSRNSSVIYKLVSFSATF